MTFSPSIAQISPWKAAMQKPRVRSSLSTQSISMSKSDDTANSVSHRLIGRIWKKSLNSSEISVSVPYQYSSNISIQIRVVDLLEDLGIAYHFVNEIEDILKETHRLWLENHEEITSSLTTYAMAFRLLRAHGYKISADPLVQGGKNFVDSMDGFVKTSEPVLELYKASQLRFPGELSLKDLSNWARDYLCQELSKYGEYDNLQEVKFVISTPHFASLHRLEHINNITLMKTSRFREKKLGPWLHHDLSEEILAFAIKEFNGSQQIYQKELEQLKRWIEENRIDQLKVPRQTLMNCYFSTASTSFQPQMADARLSCAKNGVLVTLIDDFFDVFGSREEHINLIKLVEEWEDACKVDYISDQVKIIYSALYSTINEIGVGVISKQGYNITESIINIWRDLLRSFMKEAEWAVKKTIPSMEQYMNNGYVSFGLGPIIFPALYLIGPSVNPNIVNGPECGKMYRLVSTCGRLANDIQSFEREDKDGKLNSVSLLVIESGGAISVDEAKQELMRRLEREREELLELVLKREEDIVPRACKDIFWNMSKILHLFYSRNDGFSSPTQMLAAINSVLYKPL